MNAPSGMNPDVILAFEKQEMRISSYPEKATASAHGMNDPSWLGTQEPL
jgi:hypothetical protein